jgi:hypothetical protein
MFQKFFLLLQFQLSSLNGNALKSTSSSSSPSSSVKSFSSSFFPVLIVALFSSSIFISSSVISCGKRQDNLLSIDILFLNISSSFSYKVCFLLL